MPSRAFRRVTRRHRIEQEVREEMEQRHREFAVACLQEWTSRNWAAVVLQRAVRRHGVVAGGFVLV